MNAFDQSLMHGCDYDGQDVAGWYGTEKFDGFRVRWDGSVLYTRHGVKLNAPAWFTAGLPRTRIDGELFAGYGRRAVVSSVTQRKNADWSALRLICFDLPHTPGDYVARHAALRALRLPAHVEACPLIAVEDTLSAFAEMLRIVGGGGEGLMLHSPSAPYRAGRTAQLLKLKPHNRLPEFAAIPTLTEAFA
jgi:DNA ligase-1